MFGILAWLFQKHDVVERLKLCRLLSLKTIERAYLKREYCLFGLKECLSPCSKRRQDERIHQEQQQQDDVEDDSDGNGDGDVDDSDNEEDDNLSLSNREDSPNLPTVGELVAELALHREDMSNDGDAQCEMDSERDGCGEQANGSKTVATSENVMSQPVTDSESPLPEASIAAVQPGSSTMSAPVTPEVSSDCNELGSILTGVCRLNHQQPQAWPLCPKIPK